MLFSDFMFFIMEGGGGATGVFGDGNTLPDRPGSSTCIRFPIFSFFQLILRNLIRSKRNAHYKYKNGFQNHFFFTTWGTKLSLHFFNSS